MFSLSTLYFIAVDWPLTTRLKQLERNAARLSKRLWGGTKYKAPVKTAAWEANWREALGTWIGTIRPEMRPSNAFLCYVCNVFIFRKRDKTILQYFSHYHLVEGFDYWQWSVVVQELVNNRILRCEANAYFTCSGYESSLFSPPTAALISGRSRACALPSLNLKNKRDC